MGIMYLTYFLKIVLDQYFGPFYVYHAVLLCVFSAFSLWLKRKNLPSLTIFPLLPEKQT